MADSNNFGSTSAWVVPEKIYALNMEEIENTPSLPLRTSHISPLSRISRFSIPHLPLDIHNSIYSWFKFKTFYLINLFTHVTTMAFYKPSDKHTLTSLPSPLNIARCFSFSIPWIAGISSMGRGIDLFWNDPRIEKGLPLH